MAQLLTLISFDVETEKVGVHTSDSVRYAFNVPLVAADIAFKNFGPKDKISYKYVLRDMRLYRRRSGRL
jgi:hypothetical protein